jgi:hypothetical protein
VAVVVNTRDEVLAGCRRMLGLSSQDATIDRAFLAALLRHTAGIFCPCSAATLRAAALESMQHLSEDEGLASKVDDAIEGLVVGGDLLELSQVTTDDPSAKGTWLFAAPPTFVMRPSGSIFLTGIVADRDTYLPSELMSRIRYDGYTRAIMPAPAEGLSEQLIALGLQKLSEENWLKLPKFQKAEELRDAIAGKLRMQQRSGDIPDLQIIDPSRPVTYYRGRWIKPKRQSGVFVARRPQQYGAPIWCVVDLEDGEPRKLLDFPTPRSRWRGCDEAWRLQMAIDRANGTPQVYRVRGAGEYAYVDFFSPLPLWAERHLMLVGRHEAPEKCLFSYRLRSGELAAEEEYLQKHLWLARVTITDSGDR